MANNGRFPAGMARLGFLALLIVASQGTARAQLAITEVMSDASTNRGTMRIENQSDFWELTNFSTNAINLAGYSFSDSIESPLIPLVGSGDPPLVIGAGQSVLFVRSRETTNEAQFRAWWGDCLPLNVPVRFYPRTPGFDQANDGIRLWDAFGSLVDRVDFGRALRGVTFISDTNTGEFGALSQMGTCGACRASTADDIASPGATCGPVPLQIVSQPESQTVCAGVQATFIVRAIGLPRPKYQWFQNNTIITGASAASYTITNVSPAQNSAYRVEVSNGLMLLQSIAAILTVSTNPSAPSILSAPIDAEVYSNQTAQFSVTACAFPLASYQWFSNGVLLAGATNPVLSLPNCTPAMSGVLYCVRASNPLGTNTVCARLIVSARPNLRITEIMPSAGTNCPQHAEWFELTNQGTNTVNLLGHRFSDRFVLTGARVITQAVTLLPDQSAIFVEGMSPEAFRQWWGDGNLKPELAVIPYTGLGLSELGDELYLWNAAALDAGDYVDSKSFAGVTNGISLRFDEGDCYFGCESVVSELGAFRSMECGDIGSPGYTNNGPPRLLGIARDAFGAHVTWHAVEGKTYRLEYNPVLQTSGWISLGEMIAADSLPTKTDPSAVGQGQRFYRVVQLTP